MSYMKQQWLEREQLRAELKASIKGIDLIQHIRPSDQWSQSELDAFYGEPEKPKAEPTCEADKPEGTRDVDKFLKEQQEKLWRGD